MKHAGTQTIKTSRLTLRKIELADAEMMYIWMGDPEVCKYERWQPHPSADWSRGYIAEVFDGYKSDRTYQWGIEFEGKLIGSVSIVHIDDNDQNAALGYCLAREFWSNGYTTEAVKSVIDYMFANTGIERIEAYHSVNNPASGRVMAKAGMRREGFARHKYKTRDGFQDCDLYGIVRDEWEDQ